VPAHSVRSPEGSGAGSVEVLRRRPAAFASAWNVRRDVRWAGRSVRSPDAG